MERRWLHHFGSGTLAFAASACLSAIALTNVAAAQDKNTQLARDAGCASVPAETVTIRDIDPNFDIALRDGRMVTLAGIEPPRNTRADPARAERVRGALGSAAGEIGLLSLGPRDRWGRTPVALFGGGENLGRVLLANGDARYRPDTAARPCREMFLRSEAEARDANRGVWSDPELAVIVLDDAKPVVGSGFIVIEGIVKHVGETPARIYLDLGRARGGFALSASKRDIGLMRSEMFSQAKSVGSRVRARGLADRSFKLDLASVDSFELVAPAPAPAQR